MAAGIPPPIAPAHVDDHALDPAALCPDGGAARPPSWD
jgi:hypothetical protein